MTARTHHGGGKHVARLDDRDRHVAVPDLGLHREGWNRHPVENEPGQPHQGEAQHRVDDQGARLLLDAGGEVALCDAAQHDRHPERHPGKADAEGEIVLVGELAGRIQPGRGAVEHAHAQQDREDDRQPQRQHRQRLPGQIGANHVGTLPSSDHLPDRVPLALVPRTDEP